MKNISLNSIKICMYIYTHHIFITHSPLIDNRDIQYFTVLLSAAMSYGVHIPCWINAFEVLAKSKFHDFLQGTSSPETMEPAWSATAEGAFAQVS